MQLTKLLSDATGAAAGASKRSQYAALAAKLNEKFPDAPITVKGVEKWFARESIPAEWMMRVAALPSEPLNLHEYT